jgi:hypothetical protein
MKIATEEFRETIADASSALLLRLMTWPIAIGFLACFVILFRQCVKYLQIGEWPSLSVIDALHYFGSEWARAPDAWLGVHDLLDFMPMSFAAVLLGFAPGLVIALLKGKMPE